MIRELPDAHNLLETALTSLRNDLLPHLPDHARYTGLMVANALAITLRDLQADAARAVVSTEITRLTGEPDGSALCQAMEAGAFDDPETDRALRQALLAITRARLSINNPKALG